MKTKKTTATEVETPVEKVAETFELGDRVVLTDDAKYSIDGRGIADMFFGKTLVVTAFGIVPEIVEVTMEDNTDNRIYVGTLNIKHAESKKEEPVEETTEAGE